MMVLERINVLHMGGGKMADFDALWNYSDGEATTEKFLNVLENTTLSGNESYVAELYTQLARAQGLAGHTEEAYVYLDKAKALLNQADEVAEVRYLLELGRVELGKTFHNNGDNKPAYELFEKAWELAKQIHADGHAVDAAHMLAIAADGHQGTLDWNLEAVKYAQNSDQVAAQKWLGSLYNNLGWTYFEDGDLDSALEMFQQALAEREKYQQAENIRVARWCIARTQRELGQVETALQTQLELLAEREKINSTDEYIFEELAHCFQLIGNREKSSEFAHKAYDIFSASDFFTKNEPERIQALKDMI